jgi:hypothetical protein
VTRLRAALDAALVRESERCGQPLRWDEREAQHVDAAVRAADHVEALQRLLDDELAGERRPSIVVKLTAEIRLQDHVISEHLGRIQIGDLVLFESPQHQAAAVARWGANRPKKRGV